MSNPFQNIGRNAACLLVVAVTSVIAVKTNVRNKKEANYAPSARVVSNQRETNEYYSNTAQIQPGFPLLPDAEKRERKSIYEGPGLSRESRRKGDKLGFLDRWWG